MSKNIVLIGFMGTGKSAIAKRLASFLQWKSYDIDTIIEQEQSANIPEIFTTLGEERFREIETEIISRISHRTGVIISTGGGAPTIAENMLALKRNGIIVRLIASPETILKRAGDLKSRPMLANTPDPLARIEELLKEREPHYSKADITIDTDGKSLKEVIMMIVKAVEQT